MKYEIKALNLAEEGRKKIFWAGQQMPVLQLIKERFNKEKPLKGITLSACLHVTAETANLMLVLQLGGAKVTLCASNPLSTQDDVAASLVKDFKIPVFAIKNEDNQTYYRHLHSVLDFKPQVTMDDGADLVSLLHTKRKNQLKDIFGSSEETTTGVIRLKAMAKAKALKVPVIATNDSLTKHLFDNRYGTGQSTLDGILRATNVLLAGKNVVVVGYGWCGRGVALRARGHGANVIVVEVDSVKALEAAMDGFRVMSLSQAARIGDVFVTVTGNKHVIDLKHFKLMKNGAILANSGHFDVEINVAGLESIRQSKKEIRPFLTEYDLGGKKLYLLANGRLVNLAAAEGHPPEVMDLSFANQSLAAEFIVQHKNKLKLRVYTLPKKIDRLVARLKLKAMGMKLERLTPAQRKYLSSWQEGT